MKYFLDEASASIKLQTAPLKEIRNADVASLQFLLPSQDDRVYIYCIGVKSTAQSQINVQSVNI